MILGWLGVFAGVALTLIEMFGRKPDALVAATYAGGAVSGLVLVALGSIGRACEATAEAALDIRYEQRQQGRRAAELLDRQLVLIARIEERTPHVPTQGGTGDPPTDQIVYRGKIIERNSDGSCRVGSWKFPDVRAAEKHIDGA